MTCSRLILRASAISWDSCDWCTYWCRSRVSPFHCHPHHYLPLGLGALVWVDNLTETLPLPIHITDGCMSTSHTHNNWWANARQNRCVYYYYLCRRVANMLFLFCAVFVIVKELLMAWLLWTSFKEYREREREREGGRGRGRGRAVAVKMLKKKTIFVS